jgi:hypothetical protein
VLIKLKQKGTNYILTSFFSDSEKGAEKHCSNKKKVKNSLYRPLGLQEVEAHRVSGQLAHEGGKVVSPAHQPPLSPRRYLRYSCPLMAES